MVDVIKIETDLRRCALTKEEFTELQEWARLAPESHFVDTKGSLHFQTTIPSQWLRCLLATIEHGYRDPNEVFGAARVA